MPLRCEQLQRVGPETTKGHRLRERKHRRRSKNRDRAAVHQHLGLFAGGGVKQLQAYLWMRLRRAAKDFRNNIWIGADPV
ncbi:hypothetical protein CQ12_16625 [Bradyrhizobium jicamae]|uniref:Uncharacterized protein n=1 Tax=Bradyrhizobium jicamae TaxID=280332 RepID=A0A0R3LMM8_9BRAD|nr:hypothetical protein CQ12_16625 [Bradyrhizobium jicamae]